MSMPIDGRFHASGPIVYKAGVQATAEDGTIRMKMGSSVCVAGGDPEAALIAKLLNRAAEATIMLKTLKAARHALGNALMVAPDAHLAECHHTLKEIDEAIEKVERQS